MNLVSGIMLKNRKRAFFLDCEGKDFGFNRWRIDAYYDPHFAETLFFGSEKEYKTFIDKARDSVFLDYTAYTANISSSRR